MQYLHCRRDQERDRQPNKRPDVPAKHTLNVHITVCIGCLITRRIQSRWRRRWKADAQSLTLLAITNSQAPQDVAAYILNHH